MGNDTSKPTNTGKSSPSLLSEQDTQSLRTTFEAANNEKKFGELFKVTAFSNEELAKVLAENLQRLVLPKKSDTACLKLDNISQYKHMFQLFLKEMSARNRLEFYWKLFPNFLSFFSAAVVMSRIESNDGPLSESEFVVANSLADWIERVSETFSSQLITLEGAERNLCLLQLFIEQKIPRVLIYFDRWIYESFTQHKHAKNPGNFDFLNAEEARSRSMVPLLDNAIRWSLSIAIPAQTLYLESEERISSRAFPIELFGTHSTIHNEINLSVTWDLVYDTDRDGSGMKRLGEAVYGYSASSLLLIESSDNSVFGGYIPLPWPRYKKTFFGDDRGFLVSVQPNLAVYSSLGMSENYIRFPDKERRNESQLGIGFGGQRSHERLWIDGGDNFINGTKMDMCSTYSRGCFGPEGSEFQVRRLQIWGFGGTEALEHRADVRKRDDKFTERSKKVDPSAFFGEGQSITDNPDKMMMDWMSTKKAQQQ